MIGVRMGLVGGKYRVVYKTLSHYGFSYTTVSIVYRRFTQYLSSSGNSLYLLSSSSPPTGRSWQSYVVRRRSLQIATEAQSPMSQSLDPAEEQPRRRMLYCRRMRAEEMKWLRRERWWLVKENVVELGISKDQSLCPRHKSTLWEPWSTSLSASPPVGCRCTPPRCCQK